MYRALLSLAGALVGRPASAGSSCFEDLAGRAGDWSGNAGQPEQLELQVRAEAERQENPECRAFALEAGGSVALGFAGVRPVSFNDAEPVASTQAGALAWAELGLELAQGSLDVRPGAAAARLAAIASQRRLEVLPDPTPWQVEQVARSWTHALWLALTEAGMDPIPSGDVELAARGGERLALACLAKPERLDGASHAALMALLRLSLTFGSNHLSPWWEQSFKGDLPPNEADRGLVAELRIRVGLARTLPAMPGPEAAAMAVGIRARLLAMRALDNGTPELGMLAGSSRAALPQQAALVESARGSDHRRAAELREQLDALWRLDADGVVTPRLSLPAAQEIGLLPLVANGLAYTLPPERAAHLEPLALGLALLSRADELSRTTEAPFAWMGPVDLALAADAVSGLLLQALSELDPTISPAATSERARWMDRIAPILLRMERSSPALDELRLLVGKEHPRSDLRAQALEQVARAARRRLLSRAGGLGDRIADGTHLVYADLLLEPLARSGGSPLPRSASSARSAALSQGLLRPLAEGTLDSTLSVGAAGCADLTWLLGQARPELEAIGPREGLEALDALQGQASNDGPLCQEQALEEDTQPAKERLYPPEDVPEALRVEQTRRWLEALSDIEFPAPWSTGRLGLRHAVELASEPLLQLGALDEVDLGVSTWRPALEAGACALRVAREPSELLGSGCLDPKASPGDFTDVDIQLRASSKIPPDRVRILVLDLDQREQGEFSRWLTERSREAIREAGASVWSLPVPRALRTFVEIAPSAPAGGAAARCELGARERERGALLFDYPGGCDVIRGAQSQERP